MVALSVPPGSSPARALNIAFLACNRNPRLFRQDPSFIYRCENLGLALQGMGHRVSWLHWSTLRPGQRFDVAVFHRPRHSLLWRSLLWWLRRHGTTLVADVDDLVFDPQLSRYSPSVVNGQMALPKLVRQFAEHAAALACFDKLTVSTDALAVHVRRCFPKATARVLPNAVHLAWRDAEKGREARIAQAVVTYFPGTRSHDRDFAVYADGIARFLHANANARLEVTGPLDFKLRARDGQVVHLEKVPFAAYAERVRTAWVNLAPLEATPFTRCKSALKVLEAGYWGTPTVCSPLPDAQRFRSCGALFASDAAECCAALQELLVPAHYAALTRGLSERVLAQADVWRTADEFLKFVGEEERAAS
ncbi:hypothetical protein [Candidatus Accumulibacter sp. ACC003]|uniref:hypothetical protein n=1 Tax=Candidatus Accumulibacter sp. ACC003 TaxID=2823334 RepID=UPI0025BA55BC|nr:hypothetical protein [Candidatus Accumulibacter sp. ACC003]